jgi:hypothetical protein
MHGGSPHCWQTMGSIWRSALGNFPVSAGMHQAKSMLLGVWLEALQATWQE